MSRDRKRRRDFDDRPGGNWLTTYSDMVTLLLTFFVLLFTFSTIDVMKFQKLILSFRGAIGIIDGGRSIQEEEAVFSGQTMVDAGESRVQTTDIVKVAERIQEIIREKGLEHEVTVAVNERGVVVSIAEGVLFKTGAYELRPDGIDVIASIGNILQEIDNQVSVEGHTDNVPFRRGGFVGDNWALSSLRAARIVAVLQGRSGIDPRRLQSVGYGPSRPIMPNDTAEHRQMNRRADIVILSENGG
jgi:chemotaxis protein MotB